MKIVKRLDERFTNMNIWYQYHGNILFPSNVTTFKLYIQQLIIYHDCIIVITNRIILEETSDTIYI